MIKVKNNTTGEMIQVWQTGIDKATGRIYCNGEPTAKYLTKYPLIATSDKRNEKDTFLELSEGWELVKRSSNKPNADEPKPETVVNDEPTTTESEPATVDADNTNTNTNEQAETPTATSDATESDTTSEQAPATVDTTETEEVTLVNAQTGYTATVETPTDNEPESEPKPKAKRTRKAKTTETNADEPKLESGVNLDAIKDELTGKYGAMGTDIFEAACKLANVLPHAINEEDVDALINKKVDAIKAAHMTQTEIVINDAAHTVTGVTTENFEKIVVTVKKGFPVYMHGDAGTGKSHTAKQVAEALGLDFYESQQVLFAHEMKGYGDAGGNFVPTPFFKAFTQGGLFFLDEIDASQPEALVVLNTAIANRRFDFPVIGNVSAHPDFRVIAAGNTKMTGADIEYTARSVQDASTKNRFFFVHVDYCPAIENMLAGDDLTVADFCRDLRKAKTETKINLCVSYRQIETLADKDLQKAWGVADLLTGAVFKELESDEIRILYNAMTNTSNKWARAMAKLF